MKIKSGKTETKMSGIFTKLQLCNACFLREMLVSRSNLAKMFNRGIQRTLSTFHSEITIFLSTLPCGFYSLAMYNG